VALGLQLRFRMKTSLAARRLRSAGFFALAHLAAAATSATALADDAAAPPTAAGPAVGAGPVEPDAAAAKPATPIFVTFEGAFGVGSLRVGKLAPDGFSGTVGRAPVTIEELTPSIGFRTKHGSIGFMNPLLLGTVEGSRTALGTGNLTLFSEQAHPLGEYVAFTVKFHLSVPTGTSEDQPTEPWGSERAFTDHSLVGGALHAGARAMSGYQMATMWDSHRWGIGSHLGLRFGGATTIEPYIGSDSRLSFTGRSSPGALLAGVRSESHITPKVTLGGEIWAVMPDPDLRNDELSATAGFAQVDAGFLLGRLKGTLSAMMPFAGPSDGPRLFAFRAGLGTNF